MNKDLNNINDNILGICEFGSRVYGTNNEDSDQDLLIVVNEYFEPLDKNTSVFTLNQFELALNNCDIKVLECFYLKDWLYGGSFRKTFENFKPDLTKLRTSISTITSNSWVKGKKKITVHNDYDPYLGIKSIFHSIRILDFGCQIASENKIVNYGSVNWLYNDLIFLWERYHRDELWEIINDRYKSKFNEMSSKFKLACPKKINETMLKIEIKKILPNISESEYNKLLKLINEYGK